MEKVSNLVLYAIGLAMGIACVVLTSLNTVEIKTMIILLGIGMFCIGLAGINTFNKK
ncbi:MAG: hypothetical protein MUO82_07945 [Candidatus Thermoplasmatota archaeon]|nr:hypothetical protein [Candidatus Thermoplasmatota archaeon]